VLAGLSGLRFYMGQLTNKRLNSAALIWISGPQNG
jgi:hypothetical protein